MAEETGKEASQEQTEKSFDEMTVKELREIAKEIPDVTGIHSMKKDELLALVKGEGGAAKEKPAAKEKKETKTAAKKETKAAEKKKPAAKKKAAKKAPAKTLSVKELKKLIAALREEKIAAQQAKDRKQTDILRRQINRLKKKTRKAAGPKTKADAAPAAAPETPPEPPPEAAPEAAPEAPPEEATT